MDRRRQRPQSRPLIFPGDVLFLGRVGGISLPVSYLLALLLRSGCGRWRARGLNGGGEVGGGEMGWRWRDREREREWGSLQLRAQIEDEREASIVTEKWRWRVRSVRIQILNRDWDLEGHANAWPWTVDGSGSGRIGRRLLIWHSALFWKFTGYDFRHGTMSGG